MHSTWMYLKGIYSYALSQDDGVDAFRDMVVSAGAKARERFKDAGARIRLSNKVTAAFEESGVEFRDKNAVSELFKKFEGEKHKKDYSQEAMSHRGKTDVEVLAKSKDARKKLKKAGVTTLQAVKVAMEDGTNGYIPPPLNEQGDLASYTKEAMKRRTALRSSLTVKKGILRWWCTLGFSGFVPNTGLASLARYVGKQHLKQKKKQSRFEQIQALKGPKEELEYDKSLEIGAISKNEYIQMCVEIWKVVGEFEDPEDFDEKEARRSSAKDWKEDSKGQK
ncbi:hypothetical protein CYMTET_11306, partial [Cymbomonas tetramitiformis]